MRRLDDTGLLLAAEEVPQALQNTWKFFTDGGLFMGLIVLCSFVALAVIVYKALTLSRSRVVPDRLAREVERIDRHYADGTVLQVHREFREGENALARLGAVALANQDRPPGEVQEAVQSSAREEVVRLQSGLPVLEVVITVAPLLGLLGTASGLVVIFGNTEDIASGVNNAKIGAGIARALGTTIAGLVVAVPAVIAHSVFSRKIETMAARLEVLLERVIAAGQGHAWTRTRSEAEATEAGSDRRLTQMPQ